jgi:hypothetical protein
MGGEADKAGANEILLMIVMEPAYNQRVVASFAVAR